MKKFLIKFKGKLYIVPFLYGVGFGIFSIIVLVFDTIAYSRFKYALPAWFFVSGSKSVSVVSLVVSSLITMVTITFSIMMVVLTIYGSRLSSKSLQDFLGKKNTLRILGYFIGSLVFSLIQLTFGKDRETSLSIGPTVSVILLMIAIIVLVYFIHYISKSIQINLYIDDITNETLALINESKNYVDSSIYIEGGQIKDYAADLQGEAWEILSDVSGYIQYYDRKNLLTLAEEFNGIILCEVLIGEYIMPKDVLIRVYNHEGISNKEEVITKLIEAVSIGDEPDLYKDISTGTRKLLDVGLKALSPGINDPSTAIVCIQKIGYLLREIAKGLEANVYLDDDEKVRVIIRSISFNRLLYDHFYQIKIYGIKDMFVLEAVLLALTKIANESSEVIQNQVWEFAKYLIVDVDLKNYHGMEQRILSERFFQLSRAVKVPYKFDEWKSFDIH
jgi:uncharacterized membrane protein